MSADDLSSKDQDGEEYDCEDCTEFEAEDQEDEKFDGPEYAPQYFKARPYFLGGTKHPGKWHAVRYRSDTEICTVAACGMQLASCPGDLVPATPELVVDCKTCLAALQKFSWGHDVIDWRLRWYDIDEDRWMGFVSGEELYGIHRSGWYTHYDDSGDSCDSLIDGFEACHQHLLKYLKANPRRRQW
jgi:hypothetical protein